MSKPNMETMRLNRVARAFTIAALLATRRSKVAALKGNPAQAIAMRGMAQSAKVNANLAASFIKSPRYRARTQKTVNERFALPTSSWTTRWFKNP